MLKYILLIALSFFCCAYAASSIREIVFNDPTPFSIKCIGVALDPAKTFEIRNSKTKSEDTLQIDYPQGKGLLPNNLGTISYDEKAEGYALTVGNEVTNKKEASVNPFFAFARTASKDWFGFGSYSFFNAGDKVVDDLRGDGIIFNSPAGDRNSRVAIKTIGYQDKTFLSAKTEGIGISYPLEAGKVNKFLVLCNRDVSLVAAKIFKFETTTYKQCSFTIEATPQQSFDLTYTVYDEYGHSVAKGSENQLRFVTGDFLFEFSPSNSHWNLLPLFLGILVLAGFQIYILRHYKVNGTPTIQAVLAVRCLFNCLAFLSVPLFLTISNSDASRSWYWFVLFLLNLTYFSHIFHNPIRNSLFGWQLKNFFGNHFVKIAICLALVVLPFTLPHFTSNERLGPIPMLHIVKVAILVGMYAIYDLLAAKSLRYAVIVIYAAILSYFSGDFGSIIYCSSAFALIACFSGQARKWRTGIAVFVVLGVASAIGVFYFTGGAVAGGKGYRIYAQYFQPDSDYLELAKEADRETYAHLNFIQKELIDGKIPEMRNVVVPAPMRSTAFSDYALFWSLVYGKLWFAGLFILTIGFLLYQLSFLLTLTIRPINIGNGMAYLLPATRESEFIQFLLALTIVTLGYPVLSNLLIAPLTGQSLPCISISNVEPIFLALLIIALSFIFMDQKYQQPTDPRITESYQGVLSSLKKGGILILAVFVALVFMRSSFLQTVPGVYRWTKTTKESEKDAGDNLNNLNASDRNSLIVAATKLIATDERMAVSAQKRPLLRDISSLYYVKVPYSRIRIENTKFELIGERLLRRMDAASYFTVRSRQISGERSPFGRVMGVDQIVNGDSKIVYTNDYYSSIPKSAKTINADLTAELAKALEEHLKKIGVTTNKGAIVIVNNKNGGIVANSTYPLLGDTNSNEIHYLIGSLKKPILAYAALAVDSAYKNRPYRNVTFDSFIQQSDDLYAANLLKDVMQHYPKEFGSVLDNDLALPLVSLTDDAYFDKLPAKAAYSRPLDRNNEIFRLSIGQEKPYRFIDVIQWYARIASGKKIELNYEGNEKSYDEVSIDKNELERLRSAMSSVLSGTAGVVGDALEKNGFEKANFTAKTGTAEHSSGKYNSSSSFVIASSDFTIGMMINGNIPANSKGLAAKDLMVTLIPLLQKYRILN
ncbi:MAG: hypothetical protein IPM59_09330 [Chloracidobacterium sp.]|nr:hypothetical protein [Chloracidobacterium sp.]